MRHAITLAAAVGLAAAALAQVPFVWEADASAAKAAQKDVYRGESLDLRPLFLSYGSPADTNGAAFTLYWQTNGMGSAWWTDPTNAFRWTPARDAGAARYTLFIRCETPGGVSYRANASLRMLDSPGFTPATLPAPSAYPTLAADVLLLVQDRLPTHAAWTNEAAARAAGDAASSNYTHQVETNLHARIDALDLSGAGGEAAASGTALRLVSADSNWWVSVSSGTATLWRVSTADVPLCDITFSDGMPPFFPQPAGVTQFPFYAETFTVETDPGSWMRGYYLPDGRAEITSSFGSGSGLDATWRAATSDFPQQLAPADGSTAEGTASITPTGQTVAYTSTNAAGSYVTAADLAAALAAYNPAAATNALAVASNALSLAQAAVTPQQLSAVTNSLVQTYYVGTNAWIGVDYSNETVTVYTVSTNGTNTVTVGAATGVDPEATNLLWQALSAGLAAKAPKAWGSLAPDGTANPEPDYMTWLNAPATVFASGCSWSTSGTYAALVSTGTVAFAAGSNGVFRVGPDSTNWFGYVEGGSVTVGAVPDSLAVTGGGTPEGYAEIIYEYDGGAYPVVWFAASLAVDFTEVTPAWVDNLDGTATATVPATTPAGFWRATTSASYDRFFETTMPARLTGGVFAGTNSLPVVYDSVLTIESGGKTYRVPAQLVE
jgi:hypothetical protein